MKEQLTLSRHLFIGILILSILLANWFHFQITWTGILFGTYYLLFFGFIAGFVALPNYRPVWQTFVGTLILVSTISLLSSLIYFFYQFTNTVAVIITVSLPVILLILFEARKRTFSHKIQHLRAKTNLTINSFILLATFVGLEFIAFRYLALARTGLALRSPWWVVENGFFITYFLASFVLGTLVYKNKKSGLSILAVSLHTFLTLSVALIVYQIGYGFDPFIHQATEKAIAEFGFIEPKPLYYLGQYTLVVWFSQVFTLSVATIDKLLVPITAALSIPFAIHLTWQRCFIGKPANRRNGAMVALAGLLIPLSSMIVSTPQGLANLWTLLTIILSLNYLVAKEKGWLPLLIILALTATAIHPLSGVPAFIFLLLIIMIKHLPEGSAPWDRYMRYGALSVSSLLLGVSLPLIFIANSVVSTNLVVTLQIPTLTKLISISGPYLLNHFNLVYDLIYWQGFNQSLIIMIVAVLGLIIATRRGHGRGFILYPITFAVVALNFFVLNNFVQFTSLIDYERSNYSVRLWTIALFFLAPLALYGWYRLVIKTRRGFGTLRLGLILLLATALTSQVYLLYPRDDDYHLDRGYNVTASDIDAVRYVHADAPNSDKSKYIVLANQMTSVAAVREFGFTNYYSAADGSGKQYFYYPIPTGDPLYNHYLEMVYNRANRNTVLRAMELVDAEVGYFIINRYWFEFEKIVEQAKLDADSWQSIDNGESFVFKYLKT